MINAKVKLVWITAQTGARRGIGFFNDCDMEISINPFWKRISDNFFFTKASIKQKIQFIHFSREEFVIIIYFFFFCMKEYYMDCSKYRFCSEMFDTVLICMCE